MDTIGIPWFRREYYATLRLVLEDGDSLPPTYSEWFGHVEALRLALEKRGRRVIRAYIDPLEFTEWCLSKGFKFDADARTYYASWIAANSELRKRG